jgi:hypothetical protein
VKIFGQTCTARARVAEPEPGRVLSETDLDNGLVTTFTVQPDGDGSRVRIETRYEARGIGAASTRADGRDLAGPGGSQLCCRDARPLQAAPGRADNPGTVPAIGIGD